MKPKEQLATVMVAKESIEAATQTFVFGVGEKRDDICGITTATPLQIKLTEQKAYTDKSETETNLPVSPIAPCTPVDPVEPVPPVLP